MPDKLIPGRKKTPVYKKSSGFKMKSPLKKSGMSSVDQSLYKKVHNDPLVQTLSRHPENVGMSTAELKKKAKTMRG